MTTNILNNLLNEFYHPTTPNDRKKQIESELMIYKNHPNSWQQSLCLLQDFSNQFLWFFNTSTVECVITKRWNSLRAQDRITIRDTLWATYANLSPSDTPKRQRDTIAQLLALMGKRDFPDEHPDYMKNIIELLKTNCIFGVVLLRITSEEVINPKDDISSDRKKYFHSCVSLCLPEIMDIVGKLLHASICELNGIDMNLARNTNLSLPNDNQNSKLLVELLSCVQHLFSWISLDLVSDCFLINIYELAIWREDYCEVSVGALSILNELFYVQRSNPLPDALMLSIKGLLLQSNFIKSNELYQDKLTELLRLYTNKYWSKLVHNNEVLPNLVLALYSFTFTSYGALAFTEKLEVWTPLIKGLTSNGFGNGKYSDIMHSLVAGILKKMQFRFDQEQELEILDNEILDDNMETEWQHYLTQCIETIALIAEGHPVSVFDQVFNDWQRPFEIFVSLEKTVEGGIILIAEQTKCHFIHCVLRDLSSLCQTLVRLTAVLETCYERCLDKLLHIKQYLVYLIKFLGINQFQCVNVESSILKADITELYSQALLALRSLLACTSILSSESEIRDLIEEVGKILLPISRQESRIVTLAAAQLLLRIATVIRPRFMLECSSILQLMQAGSNLCYLPKQVVIVIYQTIFSCLVLPWPNIENRDQNYERRNVILQDYITCLAGDFLRIDDVIVVNGHESKVLAITVSVLPILKEVVDYFKENNSAIKQMLTNSFRCIMTKSISVYNSYGSTSVEIAESIFDFSLSVVRCLQVQLGTSFVQEMVSVFLESFSKEKLTKTRLKVMEKILRILILIVEQPGSSTMTLIPSILNLVIYHALPWLQDDKNVSNDSDAAYLLYSLFDSILQHRWQYFYKSQVLRGFSPGASDCSIPNDETPQHSDQLLAIMTAYGRVLVNGNDPHLNRIVLNSLQSLNEKWKLYSRDFFKNNLLHSFQYALINALFSSEGAIYYDLLLSVLFTMGQVNVSKLHDTFISLGCRDSLAVEDICLATDLPTFSQKVSQLIQDTRCAQTSE